MKTIFLTPSQIAELQEGGSVRAGSYLLVNIDEEDEEDEYEQRLQANQAASMPVLPS